jgi:hypothetical protein
MSVLRLTQPSSRSVNSYVIYSMPEGRSTVLSAVNNNMAIRGCGLLVLSTVPHGPKCGYSYISYMNLSLGHCLFTATSRHSAHLRRHCYEIIKINVNDVLEISRWIAP